MSLRKGKERKDDAFYKYYLIFFILLCVNRKAASAISCIFCEYHPYQTLLNILTPDVWGLFPQQQSCDAWVSTIGISSDTIFFGVNVWSTRIKGSGPTRLPPPHAFQACNYKSGLSPVFLDQLAISEWVPSSNQAGAGEDAWKSLGHQRDRSPVNL